MKKIGIFVLTVFIGILQTIAQGVSFDAKVSKRNLGLNERLRVDFIMNQNGMTLLLQIFLDLESLVDQINQLVIHG